MPFLQTFGGGSVRGFRSANPVYGISSSTSSVNEGSPVTFTVTTLNVPNGTTLYWTTNAVSGTVNASDFSDSTTSGSFTITSGSGTVTRTLANDATTEGSESFQLQIRTDSTSGTIVATSSTVTINDTSILAPLGSQSNPAISATAIINAGASTGDGYYWIKPTASSQPKYVYCDMSTDGGGWMLLINARANNGGQYYGDNEHGLSSVNGVSGVVEFNKSTTSMFGKSVINEFFQIPGFKYGRMIPTFGTSFTSPFTGLYQRIGTTTSAQWGGSSFDCSNRSNLTNSTYDWVLTQYQNWSEVQSGTNAQTGTYTGSQHYYPTTYANAYQNFWKGDQDGIRFSTSFKSEDYSGRNTLSGYFWIKTT